MIREKDGDDEVSKDRDPDLSEESSPDASPEDTDKVSGDTSGDESVETFGEPRHHTANQFSRDVSPPSLVEPSNDYCPSDRSPTVTDPPVENSERRIVDFADNTKFTPSNKSLSKAAITGSR